MSATIADVARLEPTATENPVGQWTLVWRRLRRHKLAMIGLGVLGTVVLLSLLAQWIAPYSYEEIDLRHGYAPLMAAGQPGRALHFLGTDKLGRDIFSRLLYAGRISLGVALVVTVLTTVMGTLLGAISGALSGIVDTILMRFTDVMLTLPFLPMVLVLSSSLRQYAGLQKFLGSSFSVFIIVFVLVLFGWMGNARLVRGSVLSLREQDFIAASRALGAGNNRIILRHLVPNSLAPIKVPAIVVRTVTTSATPNEMRPAYSSRERMSRPSLSVPKKCGAYPG